MLYQCKNAAWVRQCWLEGQRLVTRDRSSALNKALHQRTCGPVCVTATAGPGSGRVGGGRWGGPWVSLWERCLQDSLSLRYRSSATLPLASCSSLSFRFCLRKKPSCMDDRSHEETRLRLRAGNARHAYALTLPWHQVWTNFGMFLRKQTFYAKQRA